MLFRSYLTPLPTAELNDLTYTRYTQDCADRGLRKQMEGLCPDKLCGALQTHFHRKGRNGKQTAYPQRDCF